MYSLFLVVLCTSMHLLFFCPSFSLLSLVFSLSNVFINKATMLTREAASNLSLSLSLSLPLSLPLGQLQELCARLMSGVEMEASRRLCQRVMQDRRNVRLMKD